MNFLNPDDQALTEQFLRDGFVVAPADDLASLDYIRDVIAPHEPKMHLNTIRMQAMLKLNQDPHAKEAYYSLGKHLLVPLVGNELAMQKRFNLSVQKPDDGHDLLPIHADSWAGDSPFQVVLWVPLVDCYRTKAMWLLPPEHAKDFRLEGTSEEMFKRWEDKVKYIPVKYGEVMVFNPNLPHGNRVNKEQGTRWSLNCRFKSLYSPYCRKELGEHFEPIQIRAATQIGLEYRFPA